MQGEGTGLDSSGIEVDGGEKDFRSIKNANIYIWLKMKDIGILK